MAQKKEVIQYIGSFPPPRGGVTIKNELLFSRLSESFEIQKYKSQSKLGKTIFIFLSLFSKKKKIIGLSAAGKKSLIYTTVLYWINKKAMRQSIYFMMGGVESERIANNPKQISRYALYKRIYVELKTMKNRLACAGMENVALYPNCRARKPFMVSSHKGFKCLFFSQISKMKGADLALETSKTCRDFSFDFYGEIEESYKSDFLNCLATIPNASYCGVFASDKENVFEKLAEYDVLLFLTKWRTEGVPGVLIEAKFAGVPSVVTNTSYNSQIIHNGVDGVVLKSNDPKDISELLIELSQNRDLLCRLKSGAANDSRNYDIETYLEAIVGDLKEMERLK